VNTNGQLDALASDGLSLGDQIDLICDAFEQEWSNGRVPRVEDYLQRCDPLARDRLLAELLLVDREFRIKQGQCASRTEYRQRFPDYSTVIDGLDFATIEDRAGRPARPTRVFPMPSRGSRLAQFELLDVVGLGASGVVWKARDTRLERLVAVKLPRQESLSELERARFMREGRACARLRHPHIVPLYEVGEVHGQAFIVTQFVDGQSLREWLKKNRPKPREAAELVAQLADALHYAHDQGVIHRDLKPANVLIDAQGQPHISDFGLAKLNSHSQGMTVEGDILGTPAYMSPEQARGDAFRVDRRCDVYGLGALLYEMLTGRPPFEGEVAAVIHQAIHDEPRPPRTIDATVPGDLETICTKAMEKDAHRRYATANDLANDLRRFVAGEPILGRRVSRWEKCWRWLRRRPATAVTLALCVLVAAAGAIIAALVEKNYALAGYQTVRIMTEPAGARVALVPIDERTGEPNPDSAGIIRPRGVTPLTILAKPGKYLVEAVVPTSGDLPDFAEVRFAVAERSIDQEDDDIETVLRIRIRNTEDVVNDMVRVTIAEDERRKNALLPEVLYVDRHETAPEVNHDVEHSENEGESSFFGIEGSNNAAEALSKRLPTAAEYDAVVNYVRQAERAPTGSGNPAIEGLFGGLAEWTTTTSDFSSAGARGPVAIRRNLMVLKGYDDTEVYPQTLRTPDGKLLSPSETSSPGIGWRGVRSGAPRFVSR
jgi:serine/threonine-protein kinase